MTITPYQIIAPCVSIIAIAYAWNLWLRQKKTLWEAGLWTVFWGIVGVIAFYPSSLSYLTSITGFKDQVNAVLVTCVGILFFAVFYIVVRLEEIEQRQAEMIREIALREAGFLRGGGESTKERVG